MERGLILLLIFFVGCSPQKRLQRIIKKNPDLITQQTVIEHDTVKIESIRDTTIFKVRIDTTALDSLLMMSQALSHSLDISVDRGDDLSTQLKQSLLRDAIIKKVFPDTSYSFVLPRTMTVGDTTFVIDTKIDITIAGGEIRHTREVEAVTIPYNKTTIINNIDASSPPIWTRWWFWLIVVGVVLVIIKLIK